MSDTTTHHLSNQAFYDRIAGAYDLLADSNERAARITGLNALELQPGERVLEVGFGTGNEIYDLADKVGATGQVAGIDISRGMLRVALRKQAEKKTVSPLDLRLADARQLPFDAGTFDAVYSTFTLELFPASDIPLVLAEVMRVLKPGGRVGGVSMATVKPGDRASVLEDVYIWMHRHFPHIVDCRPIELANLLRTAGFDIVKQIDLEIWTMPVAAVVARKPALQ